MGVGINVSKGSESTFCLSFSGCWLCNAGGRTHNALPFLHHKENARCYSNSCKQYFPSTKFLHWANVCFGEHEFFKTEL